MVCKLCGRQVEDDDEHCPTCKEFLNWKYQKKRKRKKGFGGVRK